MTTAIEIDGTCDSRFGAVRDAFRESFELRGDVGAALAVMVDGKMVADLWGGHMDEARTRPWERDTIVNVWSVTKGIVAACAHRLVDQKQIDLDAPVMRYWPEFAQNYKESVLVRHLLNHTAGLPAISEPLPPDALFDWTAMTGALARQKPWWDPGAKHGYHAYTFGWLIGEVIRRVTGETVGSYFRKELAEPLGLDFHIGLLAEEDHRVAEVIPGQSPPAAMPAVADPASLLFAAGTNPPSLADRQTVNTRNWRGAEIPGANGHGNARSVARLYGALSRGGELEGVRIMSRGTIERATVEQAYGMDAVLMLNTRFALGFALGHPARYIGPSPRAFGHSGAGGSIGFADPDARVGFGYVINAMQYHPTLEDPRRRPLMDAVYDSL